MSDKKKKPIFAIKADKDGKPIVFAGINKLTPNKPLADLTKKIAETNEKIKKSLKPQTDAISLLTGKPIEIKSYNPFGFSSRTNRARSGIMSLLSQPVNGRRVRYLVPKIKPDKHKRRPVTGTGLTSYMDRHKLENPVDFAKTFLTKKGKDYNIKGFINLRFLCEQMNVTVDEALLYICEGMTRNNSRWRTHRMDKEYWRGSQSIINLVEYFDEKVAFHKSKKLNAYTIKSLHNSKYVEDLFKDYGCHKGSYSEFTRWFKKMKHHVYACKKAKQLEKQKKQ